MARMLRVFSGQCSHTLRDQTKKVAAELAALAPEPDITCSDISLLLVKVHQAVTPLTDTFNHHLYASRRTWNRTSAAC